MCLLLQKGLHLPDAHGLAVEKFLKERLDLFIRSASLIIQFQRYDAIFRVLIDHILCNGGIGSVFLNRMAEPET